jgi:hypothetical protein
MEEEKTKEAPKETKKENKKDDLKNKALIVGAAIAVLLFVGWKTGKIDFSKLTPSKSITQEEAKTTVLDFIKNNLVAPGSEVAIRSVSEEAGMYKVSIKVGGQEVDTYLTKDGKKFFPQAMEIGGDMKKPGNGNPTAGPAAEVPKSEKPDVKLFVMSYCPFGTQIEKGILPVLDALGSKIKYQLEFVSYAMHDKKELDENLRQYCIQKNQPAKLNAYLECFLKKGQGTENDCMSSAGVTVSQVSTCIDATDKQFKVTESYNDKNTWQGGQFPPFNVNKDDNQKYSVQGSPTLVINDTVAQAGRDSANLLKTICGAFNNPPEECKKELSSAAPSPGFGEGTQASGGGAGGNCGN